MSNKFKWGLAFSAPYVVSVLFLSALTPLLPDGFWLLVPISLVTEFPFIFFAQELYSFVRTNDPGRTSSIGAWIWRMCIGGFLNALLLFVLGYFGPRVFDKPKRS